MSIPSRTNGKGISRGQRMTQKPLYIVAAFIGLTLFGIYYAASNRATVPISATESRGEEMFEVVAGPQSQIMVMQDRPDGLAGVDQDLFDGAGEEEQGRVSDLEERMAVAYEQQQLKKMQQDSDMRERMIQHQIDQAQKAIEGDMAVSGFGPKSDFARQRPERPTAQPNYREISASTTGLPVNQTMGQAGVAPGLPNAAILNGITPQQLQQIVSNLPPEYKQVLQTLAASDDASTPRRASSPSTNTVGVNASNQYLETQKRDFTLRSEVESPRTRYEIKTGTVLPAAMISAANSDLPGDIVGQITQNIYDTQTGKYILIPQGTKLFGRYDAFTQLGQERLLIVWDRLIFPDAETLDIGGMQGYDGFGQAGLKDKVNTHFVRTLFNAFLVSMVSASGEALTEAATRVDDSFILNLSTSFGDAASAPFDEYLRNRLRIKPTLQIRSGFRFNVMVSKDISLDAPYRYGYKLQLARP